MKLKGIGIWICATCLITSVGGLAQQSDSLPQRRSEHHGVIKAIYQSGNDQTVIALQPYRVWEKVDAFHLRERVIKVMAGYSFPGKKPTVPKVIEFDIIADTISEPRFEKEDLEFTASVDGDQISFGKLRFKREGPRVPLGFDEVNCFNGCRIFHEELLAYFTYEGLLRITKAKKVTLQAGSVKLKLDKDLLEALRDFASRATP